MIPINLEENIRRYSPQNTGRLSRIYSEKSCCVMKLSTMAYSKVEIFQCLSLCKDLHDFYVSSYCISGVKEYFMISSFHPNHVI